MWGGGKIGAIAQNPISQICHPARHEANEKRAGKARERESETRRAPARDKRIGIAPKKLKKTSGGRRRGGETGRRGDGRLVPHTAGVRLASGWRCTVYRLRARTAPLHRPLSLLPLTQPNPSSPALAFPRPRIRLRFPPPLFTPIAAAVWACRRLECGAPDLSNLRDSGMHLPRSASSAAAAARAERARLLPSDGQGLWPGWRCRGRRHNIRLPVGHATCAPGPLTSTESRGCLLSVKCNFFRRVR